MAYTRWIFVVLDFSRMVACLLALEQVAGGFVPLVFDAAVVAVDVVSLQVILVVDLNRILLWMRTWEG